MLSIQESTLDVQVCYFIGYLELYFELLLVPSKNASTIEKLLIGEKRDLLELLLATFYKSMVLNFRVIVKILLLVLVLH